MARWFRCFKTKEEQRKWEQEQSSDPDFKLCMRMTAKELEKDLCLPDGQLDKYKYATIYKYVD